MTFFLIISLSFNLELTGFIKVFDGFGFNTVGGVASDFADCVVLVLRVLGAG